MKKLYAVIKNELLRYFTSPLAYVYLLSFLILNGSFAVYFGDFFNRGQADLLPMFTFMPWLYLLFIPGISMRLWAEEFRNKTIVQIVTMPVSVQTLVLGKFFASWIFCAIALLLTFPFWLTVNVLGNPDNQVIMLGYAAGLILAGCMLAISQTMSALTKNQVIALVFAVLANLFFYWSGIEYILGFFRLFLPDTIIDVIASFSFVSHFNTMIRGLLELRDIIFFASIIIFFNFTTTLIVNFKTSGTSVWLKSTSRLYYITAWLSLLIGFFGLNIIANNLTRNIQYDATEEKIFTLTDNTKRILQNLPEPVLARLYFSPILEQRNSDLRELFDTIRILLTKYKDAANGNFEFKIYNPQFLSKEEDIALAAGIQPVPLPDLNQNALFGLSLEDSLQNSEVIPFFAQNNDGELEQIVTDKIYKLHHKKKSLGILTGLPIFGSTSNDGTFLGQPWQIVETLQQDYDITNIVRPEDFEHGFDVLMIVYPLGLSDKFVAAIKNFSRHNGKILLLLDPANESSRLYSYENTRLHSSVIGELADFWGFTFYDEYVVADLQNSITVDATTNYEINPVFTQDVIQFKVKSANMNPYHPVTSGLNEIMMASASVILPQQAPYEAGKITFQPLLRAGDISSVMTSKVVIDGLNPQQILKYFQPDDNTKIMAAEISGNEKENPFDLIVVGDTDLLYDTFWATKKRLLDAEYVINSFDNANFILNALDYLTGNDSMIGLRGKKNKDRAFAGIEDLRRINSLQYKQAEDAVFTEMDKAKYAMQEIVSKRHFEERDTFTADEMTTISNIKKQLTELRQSLSDLRNRSFYGIKRISDFVSLINIWLIPGLISLVWLFCGLLKARKQKNFSCTFGADTKLLKLAFYCVLLLVCGFISVYLANHNDVDSYEGKAVFPKVSDNINAVNRIELTSNDGTLIFNKQNNLWVLENSELPVRQERIRRLLLTIAQATYFERKTNKAENLAMFNLSPLEDKNSKVISVALKDNDTTVQQFYLGNIDIDLGRGSTAAFIRFEDQFQVWEIVADFVDMELKPQKWTYDTLWDLSFGRLYSVNNDEAEENRLMQLMKYMLNTEIIAVTDKIPPVKPDNTIKLYIEDGNYADMDFYSYEQKSYIDFHFDKNNTNNYLKLFAEYLTNKTVEINNDNMEKIIGQLK